MESAAFQGGAADANLSRVFSGSLLGLIDHAEISIAAADYTVAMFIMSTTLGSSDFAAGKYGSAGNREWALEKTAADAIKFTHSYDGTNVTTVTGATMSISTWYHVICTHEDGVGLTLYVDNDSGTTTAETRGGIDSTANLQVGCIQSVAASSFGWAGRIARFQMWSRLLTASERTWLYNGGVGRFYSEFSGAEKSSLIGCWNLNETRGAGQELHAARSVSDRVAGSVTSAAGPS